MMKDKMNITKNVVKYINDNYLSVEEISKATGVNEHLLLDNEHRALNATEFLEVCSYLDVDPKRFDMR